jgi:2-iminobutanoate/2-iminopropanoate deaminase
MGKIEKHAIQTPLAPSAIGPYSQGIRASNLLFVSGQVPIDPATGALIEAKDIQSQTRRALQNLKEILAAGGATLDNVVRTTVFLKSMNDFAEMNAVYAEFFQSSIAAPARATVEVSRLPRDASIEIDCIAVL